MSLKRFVETFSVSKNDGMTRSIPLKEGIDTLTEDTKGNKYKCVAAYRVPVSRYDFTNLNGRDYPKGLWENVIKSQKQIWEGGDGLANHPGDNEDGSVLESFAVWHNVGFSESMPGIVEADMYLIGDAGRLAQEKLDAGGKLGLSSSGFGELLEDGKTVNPLTYQLERVADWVLNPSQQVFVDSSMRKKESTSGNTKVSEDIKTKETQTMSESTAVKPMPKSERRLFRRSVEEFLSEATSITNPSERMKELTEILSYFDENAEDFSDLKEQVQKAVEAAQSEIDTAINEHIELKTTLGVENVATVAEGIEKIVTDTELYEKQSRDWKKIAASLQEKLKEALDELTARPTNEIVENLKAKTEKAKTFLEKKIQFLTEKIAKYQESMTKNAALTETALNRLQSLQKKTVEAETKNATLLKEIAALKEKNSKLTSLVEEAATELDRVQEAESLIIREAPITTPVEMFEGFNEASEVQAYYEDLVARHGKEITPYRQHILECKTLREASKAYTNILAQLDHIPYVSEAMDVAERKQMTENATGRKILTRGGLKKPQGWE